MKQSHWEMALCFSFLLFFILIIKAHGFSSRCPCEPDYKCVLNNCVLNVDCPTVKKQGNGPPKFCKDAFDPNRRPPSKLESWFTEDIFNDLFPKANLGWGANKCFPYNYKAFIIAARYFPEFGTESPTNGFTARENYRRDLAAFFAHAIQETGENDASLYSNMDVEQAHACFYRGGFYNWFEGGPGSSFLPPNSSGYSPTDGDKCNPAGRYCSTNAELDHFYPCSNEQEGNYYKGCYFGRGAIQLSYNFNYGQFQQWLHSQNIIVDLLKNPNLLMTKVDPPLAILGSVWFYMTPQPPKPAMHDIIMDTVPGNWESGPVNREAGYFGPIFGPTSLIINNECSGEDQSEPGGPGESRRIKAFKWFCDYFGVPTGDEELLSCKNMPKKFGDFSNFLSFQPDWSSTWKEKPCSCAPAQYGGMIPYFQPGYYPERYVRLNEQNRRRCVQSNYLLMEIIKMNLETKSCISIGCFKMAISFGCTIHETTANYTMSLISCDSSKKLAFTKTKNFRLVAEGSEKEHGMLVAAIDKIIKSVVECLDMCYKNDQCISFNYRPDGNTCEIIYAALGHCLVSFNRIPQLQFIGYARNVLRQIDVETCLSKCLATSKSRGAGYNCKSVVYYYPDSECILNSESIESKPDLSSPAEADTGDVDYFTNNCAGDWSEWSKWSVCNSDGKQSRTRQCSVYGSCPGEKEEIRQCESESSLTKTESTSVIPDPVSESCPPRPIYKPCESCSSVDQPEISAIFIPAKVHCFVEHLFDKCMLLELCMESKLPSAFRFLQTCTDTLDGKL
ncbi:putative PAN domain protein [Trichinella spiralis]|uniref:putative PAN domain protein n=1 Tax=Trichinella spiralis TaxID=6334 RepID=UPI0001EFCEAB|nr:putative PAN domain protein [Trichinella spiralis]